MQETSASSTSVSRLGIALPAVSILVIAVAAYAFHERSVTKRLAEQNSCVTSALNATLDKVSALSARVDALTAEKAEKPSAPVYQKPMKAAASRHRIEDPRWKKMQGQLDDQEKRIDSTRQDIASARTELTSSIATTHDELILLEKKGERSYFEFDIDRSGQFSRQGSVGVRLTKANTKHEYADLELLVDDFKVSKKHVNIYEPVTFYSADSKMPVELVINTISKNHIHGYVSAPKYKGSDLEAMANSSGNSAAGQPPSGTKPSPAQRQRLEVPGHN